jgi:hypothetical protein
MFSVTTHGDKGFSVVDVEGMTDKVRVTKSAAARPDLIGFFSGFVHSVDLVEKLPFNERALFNERLPYSAFTLLSAAGR